MVNFYFPMLFPLLIPLLVLANVQPNEQCASQPIFGAAIWTDFKSEKQETQTVDWGAAAVVKGKMGEGGREQMNNEVENNYTHVLKCFSCGPLRNWVFSEQKENDGLDDKSYLGLGVTPMWTELLSLTGDISTLSWLYREAMLLTENKLFSPFFFWPMGWKDSYFHSFNYNPQNVYFSESEVIASASNSLSGLTFQSKIATCLFSQSF